MHSIVVCFLSLSSSSLSLHPRCSFVLTMLDKNHVRMHATNEREQQQQKIRRIEHNKSYNELPLFTGSILSTFNRLQENELYAVWVFLYFYPFF